MKSWNLFYKRHAGYADLNREVITPADAYATIRLENLKVVNNMVKTFEMKKSAALNARTMSAKTGLIDMTKLPFYKLTDDIFLQNEVTPEGKNHAIMMYLDMSSSMNGEGMNSALSQIINMAMFCDKVSIPYRVYGFSDRVFHWATWTERYGEVKKSDWKYGMSNVPSENLYRGLSESGRAAVLDALPEREGFRYDDRNMHLVELIRSDAPKADRLKALGLFSSSIIGWRSYKTHTYHAPSKIYAYNFTYGLTGSTPLNISLYIAPKLINSYRDEVGAEKVTFFIYTDGDATDPFYDSKARYMSYSTSYVDPNNGYYKVSQKGEVFHLYNILVDRIKFLTGATTIGMRVGNMRELELNYEAMMELYMNGHYIRDFDIRSVLRKGGFHQSEEVLGYDHFTWATK